jgi:hypothetical protein
MYSKSVTESSKSVLIEVLRVLGSYRDYLVLTGGWAPYFVLERFGYPVPDIVRPDEV